jgi:hypothetical protein
MFKNLAFLVIVVCSFVFADQYGIKAGLNNSMIYGKENNENYSYSLSGFKFGCFYNFEFNDLTVMQLEANFTQKGNEEEKDDIEYTSHGYYYYNETGKLRLNYLELPILLKLRLYSFKSIVWYAYSGASIDLLVNGEMVYNYSSDIISIHEEININDIELESRIKKYDYSICLGSEVNFKHIVIDTRITLGIVPIYSKAKNLTLTVLVGHLF